MTAGEGAVKAMEEAIEVCHRASRVPPELRPAVADICRVRLIGELFRLDKQLLSAELMATAVTESYAWAEDLVWQIAVISVQVGITAEKTGLAERLLRAAGVPGAPKPPKPDWRM